MQQVKFFKNSNLSSLEFAVNEFAETNKIINVSISNNSNINSGSSSIGWNSGGSSSFKYDSESEYIAAVLFETDVPMISIHRR